MSYIEQAPDVIGSPSRLYATSIRLVFIGTICASAFLLFLIQPMFSKMVVPLVGGSPGVWTTAMLFFQTILLAGYAYAHWLASSFSIARQRQIHLVVTAVAVFALPLAVPTGWTLPVDGVTPWLLALFTVSIGAPFFALSANSPLLQNWYAASGNADAGDPYFLYAASNIGSFGALLAYPLLIEPSIGLSSQGALWGLGYVVLIAGIALAGMIPPDAPTTADVSATGEQDAVAEPLSKRSIAFWMLLSFVPSSMMLSVTAKISTDIGSFPMIWVTTLGIYLLTYVFAFSARFRAVASGLPLLQMWASIGMLFFLSIDRNDAQGNFEMVLMLGFLFVTALCFHTRLAESRPDGRHLTAFFLAMSAGGALGGIFNSVLAPMVFNDVHEFTIAFALTFLAAPFVGVDWRRDLSAALPLAALGVGIVLVARSGAGDAFVARGMRLQLICIFITAIAAIMLLKARGRPVRQIALAGIALVATSLATTEPSLLLRERSFFGVYEVHENTEKKIRYIKHGTTVHGLMRTDTPEPMSSSYYAETGPFGQFFDLMTAGDDVGIVGLGAGSMACLRPGEIGKVFYEIDPLVDRIARDPRYFGLLSDCGVETPTVLGDARIEMENVGAGAHDHIVLDAFSSDAVPVHLLTREAFQTYARILPESGGLFVHISNRHFDLSGAVTRVAESTGFTVFMQKYEPDDEARKTLKAHVVFALLATRNPVMIARLSADARWARSEPWDRPVWTDDYADTLAALQ